MKLVRVLIIALGLMTIAATASFASVPFVTTSTVNEMAVNAQTGLAGNIQLTALASGSVTAGETILATFNGGTMSSLSDFQVSMAFGGLTTTTGPLGAFNGYSFTISPAVNINVGPPIPGPPTVKVTASTILIQFPVAVNFAFGDNIIITGPRFNVSASAVSGGQLTATLASGLGSATVTNPQVPVANFVDPITVSATAGSITTAGTNATTGVVKITELYPNMFETKGASPTANGSETQIIVRISNLPTGVTVSTITLPAITTSGSSTILASLVPNSLTQSTGTASFAIAIQSQDPTVNETITATVTFTAAGATLPLPLGTATVAATLGPPLLTNFLTGVDIPPITVGGNNHPLRYAAKYYPVPEANILIVIQLTTQLLAQFNSWVPGFFDTGIAIQNTTGYNTSFTLPSGALSAQTGPITAYLYPADGSAAKIITSTAIAASATPTDQSGVDSSGNVLPHATYIILLSNLAKQAGFTTGFTGQIYFIANFPNAHGINYISDKNFSVSAQGYPMLVIASPRSLASAAAPESLGN